MRSLSEQSRSVSCWPSHFSKSSSMRKFFVTSRFDIGYPPVILPADEPRPRVKAPDGQSIALSGLPASCAAVWPILRTSTLFLSATVLGRLRTSAWEPRAKTLPGGVSRPSQPRGAHFPGSGHRGRLGVRRRRKHSFSRPGFFYKFVSEIIGIEPCEAVYTGGSFQFGRCGRGWTTAPF